MCFAGRGCNDRAINDRASYNRSAHHCAAHHGTTNHITAYNRATEEDLDRGLRQGELQVQFQPIMDIHSGSIAGAEALMRWNHPSRGMVNPDEFIPLAERSGLIERLGRLAFEQAATQMRDWLNTLSLPQDFFVSINLSPSQLTNENMLSDLKGVVQEHRGIASHLKLEITESQAMTNPEHSAYMLSALRSLGVGLALDDFGTGHSSLSYLHRFPIDTIKIPAPFVQISDERGMAHTQVPIIRAIVALAADLDIMVVGEGVENLDEIDRLRQLGCNFAQGFAFGAAMTGVELQKKLQSQAAR